MATDSDAVSTAGLVRAAIDIERLPWTRPFQSAYELDFDRVAPFFAGHPHQPGAWARAIARVARGSRPRAEVAVLIETQLADRHAPAEARAQAGRLGQPETVAVVTGQQAGVFGGPIYTLLKAITAIQTARDVETREGVPAVPVFWIASEDHDWAEVRSTTVLGADESVVTVTAPETPGAGVLPVGALAFDDRIGETLSALATALPPTAWTADLVSTLGRHYVTGSNPGLAMAGLLDDLLGRHGLVVFDGSDRQAKPLVARLFAAELAAPDRSAGLVRAAGDRLAALGLPPQIIPAERATALFYLDERGRTPIRHADGTFFVADDRRPAADLIAEASAHPERFSPNVMLRPVVQDAIFPTICYVAGPGELAYHAQLGEVYEAMGVARPLVASRASATVIDAAAARFLDRYRVSLPELAVPDESALNGIVARELDPAITGVVGDAVQAIDQHMDAVRAAACAVDATLAGAADTTRGRIKQAIETLEDKIIRAAKRRDDTLRRQFSHARAQAFPGGPQDRTLGAVALLNRFGPGLLDQLLADLPADGRCHYLVVP